MNNFLGPGMLDQLHAARDLQGELGVHIGMAEGNKPELTDEGKAAAERYEAAKSRALALRGAATKLGRDLPGMESDATQLTANESGIFRKERLSRNLESFAAVTGMAKQGEANQSQMTAQMLASARSGGPVNAAVLAAFKAQEELNKETAKQVAQFEKRIRDIEGRPPRTF